MAIYYHKINKLEKNYLVQYKRSLTPERLSGTSRTKQNIKLHSLLLLAAPRAYRKLIRLRKPKAHFPACRPLLRCSPCRRTACPRQQSAPEHPSTRPWPQRHSLWDTPELCCTPTQCGRHPRKKRAACRPPHRKTRRPGLQSSRRTGRGAPARPESLQDLAK